MHVRKRIFAFLFAALAVLLCTACGKWDYSREAVKAANEAQGETLRVEFKVNQTFTNALRAAVQDNIQPTDVDKAMTMDKSIEKLLTSGYRLDVYALRADVDAEQAAEQLADEFINRLSGCEDEGFISMVKADNGYFYEAVLTYKHDSGGSGGGSGDSAGEDEEETYDGPWVTLIDGTLTFWQGASDHIGTTLGDEDDQDKVAEALEAQGQLPEGGFTFTGSVVGLDVKGESGIKKIGGHAFEASKVLTDIKLKGVETIETYAFCSHGGIKTALKSVDLGDVSDIGEWAFASRIFDNYVDLSKVRIFEPHAFRNGQGDGLIKVDLSSAESIGAYAFYWSSHKHILIGQSVDTIDTYAFTPLPDQTNTIDVTVYYAGDFVEDVEEGKFNIPGVFYESDLSEMGLEGKFVNLICKPADDFYKLS